MKNMIYRFSVLVVILILFNMTHLAGNQKDQKIIELPVGFFQEPYHVDLKSKVIEYLEENKIFEENRISIEKFRPEGLEFDVEPDEKNGIEKYGIHFWKEKGVIHGKPDIKDQCKAEAVFKVTNVKYKCDELKTTKNNKKEPVTIAYKINIDNNLPRWDAGENFYAGIGLEQSSASSSDPSQRFFGNIYISVPFPLGKKFNGAGSNLMSPLTLWGDIRLTSLPQQINSSLAEAPKELKEKFRGLQINKIVSGVDFLVGVDWRLTKLILKDKIYSLSFISAWGAINPINPIDSAQIYELNPEARKELANKEEYAGKKTDIEDETKKYVAFVNRDRKRFLLQWYFGFRIKSYINPKLDARKFPAIFEISYGFNDFIVPKFDKSGNVSNRKERGVLRIGGYLPFKYKKLNFYVFGTAFIRLSKEKETDTTDPIIMEPKFLDVTIPGNSEVVQLPIYNEPRDFFKIGIGINLNNTFADIIFKKKKTQKKNEGD